MPSARSKRGLSMWSSCWLSRCLFTILLILGNTLRTTRAFLSSSSSPRLARTAAFAKYKDDLPEYDLPEEQEAQQRQEAERWQQQAAQLREQIRQAEQQLQERRQQRSDDEDPSASAVASPEEEGPSSLLRNKRILVTGANGRLGSMVCRYLLREYGSVLREVVAVVHDVGENSSSARGYGRLAYEVGAEDGIGSIGPAWSDERVATFQYSGEIMADYHLNKLRLVECELLDPLQCDSIVNENDGVDCVIWCATDFNGNTPRAVSTNFAFLFRAVTRPTKGRVEIEGLQNMLGALKKAQQDRVWQTNRVAASGGGAPSASSSATTSAIVNKENVKNDPINFVLVSVDPEALGNFETPFGEFNAIKREAEQNLKAFPSLSSTVLQMGKYEDNFVQEGQPLIFDKANDASSKEAADTTGKRRCINRRDAARAAVEALLNVDLKGEVVQVYTAKR